MYEEQRLRTYGEHDEAHADEIEDGVAESLRLGHDVRFVLVVVGGGAVRVGREIARKHLRYLETVAVNCDSRVQDLDEFDRRVFLGSTGGDGTSGSPSVGARLAQAAEPALDRIFEGATCVTVVASLGGGTGTGALPFVLEAAARSAEFLSVFVIKPFDCEGDRRATAERAIARLHFVGGFVEKQERRHASLQVLDNEKLARSHGKLPLHAVSARWAETITGHIEHAFLGPIEAAVEARRLELVASAEPLRTPPPSPLEPTPIHEPGPPIGPMPLAPQMGGGYGLGDAELTFEIFPGSPTEKP